MRPLVWFCFDVVGGRFLAGSAWLANDMLTVRTPGGVRRESRLGSISPEEMAKRLLRELDALAKSA